MNGDAPGYDFVYDPEVRALAASLAGPLAAQLKQAEAELLRDQTENNPNIRYWFGITVIGMVSTENLDVYFVPASPLVARITEIHVRL